MHHTRTASTATQADLWCMQLLTPSFTTAGFAAPGHPATKVSCFACNVPLIFEGSTGRVMIKTMVNCTATQAGLWCVQLPTS